MPRYASPVARLLAHSSIDENTDQADPCWTWHGSRNNVGRPRIAVRIDGKSRWITVARYIAQFVHGYRWGRNERRRKAGAHSCHNGQCANPEHVTGSTQKQNIRACVAAGRHDPYSGVRARKALREQAGAIV